METPNLTTIRDASFSDILGQEQTKRQLKSAWLMDRHVIIVGAPGIGKTTIARNLARLLPEVTVNDCEYHCDPSKPLCPACKTAKKKVGTKKIGGVERFVRIQGSPDLTVEDLLGDIDPVKALTFGPMSMEAFTPGKIFRANNGILFFDEVNRCPEKLQNSLLQVLAEGRATLGAYTVDLPADFMFIGTMNPEDTSTEKLSDVFLDRFDVVEMGYPESLEIEKKIVLGVGKKLEVAFPEELLSHAILFVRLLRESKDLERKPSVRASLGLYERAQANAVLSKKKTVTQEDIDEAIVSVISHRIQLKPSVRYLQTPEQFVRNQFKAFSADEAERQDRGGGL
ncbi:MAG: ATP-binding protein [Nanoarchaeota archaeon]